MSEKIKRYNHCDYEKELRYYVIGKTHRKEVKYKNVCLDEDVSALEQENKELKKENESHVKLIQGAIASAKDYEKRIKVLDIALEKAAKCLVPFALLNPITCKKYFINQAEEEIKNEHNI